jgi:hypothetical protein
MMVRQVQHAGPCAAAAAAAGCSSTIASKGATISECKHVLLRQVQHARACTAAPGRNQTSNHNHWTQQWLSGTLTDTPQSQPVTPRLPTSHPPRPAPTKPSQHPPPTPKPQPRFPPPPPPPPRIIGLRLLNS